MVPGLSVTTKQIEMTGLRQGPHEKAPDTRPSDRVSGAGSFRERSVRGSVQVEPIEVHHL